MREKHPVSLERKFCETPPSENGGAHQVFLSQWNQPATKTWADIEDECCCLVLAEGGTGKTFEMYGHARHLEEDGCFAFFMRIEDIVRDFETSFLVGSLKSFDSWRESSNEGWFFLDSIDEGQLDDPRGFEKALRKFFAKIGSASSQAHIFISSRPAAWLSILESQLVEDLLPTKPINVNHESQFVASPRQSPSKSRNVTKIHWLQPLDKGQIRSFASQRKVEEIDELMFELEHKNLMELAGRPFDLEGILTKWKSERELGNRRELLKYFVESRLKEICADRAIRSQVSSEAIRKGAQSLAAAIILTGKTGIHVPGSALNGEGIDALTVLPDWTSPAIQDLLNRAIFDDALHGVVRFRHREVCELLCAEWFSEQIKLGVSRFTLEALFFREKYGFKFIAPRLQRVVPWLILDDERIRLKALDLQPDVALQGGDPALLPFPVRKQILTRVVGHIVQANGASSLHDSAAIALIAQKDLSVETDRLILLHFENDDALFFLCRLVWQGQMSDCVPHMMDLAANTQRTIHTRIVATRAAIAAGDLTQRRNVWEALLDCDGDFPHDLLAEVLERSIADTTSVKFLLKSLAKLVSISHYGWNWLANALRRFIDRLPTNTHGGCDQPFAKLISGLAGFLKRPPLVEYRIEELSKDFEWLLGPAASALDKLVHARSEIALQNPAIEVLLKLADVHSNRDPSIRHDWKRLNESVAAWSELNNTLFWRDVAATRTRLEKKGKSLTTIRPMRIRDHLWAFGHKHFALALSWVNSRESEEDRQVALSLAFFIYEKHGKRSEQFEMLRQTVTGNSVLTSCLNELVEPRPSPAELKLQRETIYWQREQEKRELLRTRWVNCLRENPKSLVQNPQQFNSNHLKLLDELEGLVLQCQHTNPGTTWTLLAEEFGDDVAANFRDSAMTYWRIYNPGLGSEGKKTNRHPGELRFALAGLEFEAHATGDFPAHLTESELCRAISYIPWEANGFPTWLRRVHALRPEAVTQLIQTELTWELSHSSRGSPMHYVLHSLTFNASWLHAPIGRSLMSWLPVNGTPNIEVLCHLIQIVKDSGASMNEIAELSRHKIDLATTVQELPYWYALWVDAEPDSGVRALADWLGEPGSEESSHAAQQFISILVGTRHELNCGRSVGKFNTVRHLKALYLLMLAHIPVEDDNEYASGTVYSPELRDDAQDARNLLLSRMAEIPGKDTFIALKEIESVHPNYNYRSRIGEFIRVRAEHDGDLQPWTTAQVHQFATQMAITPSTSEQLFDLAVNKLTDLKHSLEHGNDSPAGVWQKVDEEHELRTLVANWLLDHSAQQFSVSQEAELANRQQPDFLIHAQQTKTPVPIELKLLDKNWTGPKLCERLRNQLAGSYLREGRESCGIMLLVWTGRKPRRRWLINHKRADLTELRCALKKHWEAISNNYPTIAAIEIVVIDLSVRAAKPED